MAKNDQVKTEDQVLEEANKAETEEKAPLYATPRIAFETIAKRRMGNVLTAIGTLNGVTDKTRYDYTQAHWDAIFGAIDAAVAEVKERLSGDLKGTVGFTFGEIVAAEDAPKADEPAKADEAAK